MSEQHGADDELDEVADYLRSCGRTKVLIETDDFEAAREVFVDESLRGWPEAGAARSARSPDDRHRRPLAPRRAGP
ncbi:MAG: hypothetical protein LH477_18900 [Nocardioides sp.]|nr:hypothetical protein [Nocardioides sp.]